MTRIPQAGTGNVLALTDRLRAVADGEDVGEGKPRLSKKERRRQRQQRRVDVDEFADDDDTDVAAPPPIATVEDAADDEPAPGAETAEEPPPAEPLPQPEAAVVVVAEAPVLPDRRKPRITHHAAPSPPPPPVAAPKPVRPKKSVPKPAEPLVAQVVLPPLTLRMYRAVRALGVRRLLEIVALVVFPILGGLSYYYDLINPLAYGMAGLAWLGCGLQVYRRFEELASAAGALQFALGVCLLVLFATVLLLATGPAWQHVATAVLVCFAADLLITRGKA